MTTNPKKYGQPKLAVRRQVSAVRESALYASAAAWWARLTDGCRQQEDNKSVSSKVQGRTYQPYGSGKVPSQIPRLVSALRTPHSAFRVALANDTTRRAGLFALANESAIGADGYVRLATYGDHPLNREIVGADGVATVEKFIQRFTKESAVALANNHNGFFGKLRKLRRGAPIKRGHSDRWDVADEEGVTLALQKPAALENANLGMFARLEAREDALYGQPIFTDAAQTVIERERLRFFSPYWWSNIVGLENGAFVAEPYELISVALTDSPNLKDSPALANAKETQTNNKENTMKKKLIELLKKAGVALANEEDATIEAALPQLETQLTQRTALENEKSTLTTDRDAQKTALANEQTQHATTRTALENATTEVNETTVNLAIAEGRISPSERATKVASLKTGGETARKALLNEAVKYKVTPTTTDARRSASAPLDQSGATKAAKRLVALGNELFAKGGFSDPSEAYGAAKETEEGKKLVAQLDEFKKGGDDKE
jgi:hypothetical protein